MTCSVERRRRIGKCTVVGLWQAEKEGGGSISTLKPAELKFRAVLTKLWPVGSRNDFPTKASGTGQEMRVFYRGHHVVISDSYLIDM